jgi:outer membrane protein assembly factor BamB
MRRTRRRMLGGMAILGLLMPAFQGEAAAVASGTPSAMCQSNGASSSDPETDAKNRRVDDVLPVGGRLYLGGRFTSLLPPGGGTAVARGRLGACSLSTGAILSWNPGANGPVYALAGNSTTIFVGGSFTSVGGVSRGALAAVRADTGAVTSWKVSVSGGAVRAMALSGNTLYVGGAFKSVGGQARNGLAAVDAGTGALLSWNPGKAFDPAATYEPRSIVVYGSRVIVGEYYSNPMPNLMAVDAASGARLSWSSVPTRPILELSVYGSRVYAAAAGSGGKLYAYDAGTGSQKWSVSTDGNVQAVWAASDAVYAGGHFANVKKSDGTLIPRARLLAVSPTGSLLGWNPSLDQSGNGPTAMRGSTALVVGGDFKFVNAKAQRGLARFGL